MSTINAIDPTNSQLLDAPDMFGDSDESGDFISGLGANNFEKTEMTAEDD